MLNSVGNLLQGPGCGVYLSLCHSMTPYSDKPAHTGCILSSSIFPIQMVKVKIFSSDPVPEVNKLNSLGEQARV